MQVRDTAFRQTVTTLTSRVDGCQQQENSSHANGTLPAFIRAVELNIYPTAHSVEDGSFRQIVAGLRGCSGAENPHPNTRVGATGAYIR